MMLLKRTESEVISFYAVSQKKNSIINAALNDTYSMIILNVDEILEAKDDLRFIISSIQQSVKSNLVVMAVGYSPKSSLIVDAIRDGVSYFMLTENGTERNNIFVNTLAGIKNVYEIVGLGEEETKYIQNSHRKAVNAREKFTSVSVAVASCISRMGVTSVCIQLIKFFAAQGKTACYIDYTNSGYVDLCRTYYGIDSEDVEHHRITLDGIDMYYNVTAETMGYIELQNYNFMVYDIGNIHDSPQKQNDFLTKKYRLLVTGSKPNENKMLYETLDKMYRTSISYIYNFTPNADKEDLTEDVKRLGAKCYFMPYMDEVFSLVADSVPIFYDVFATELPVIEKSEEPKAEKKGLFARHKQKAKNKEKKEKAQ